MKYKLRYTALYLLILISTNLAAQDPEVFDKITLNYVAKNKYPLKNLTYQFPRTKKIALILSGGGARGFAHIGVLKAFEENSIPIQLIVGSSMGSVVGGFYAAGFNSDRLEEIVKDIDWQNLYYDETYRTNLFWSQKASRRQHILALRFDNIIPYIPSSLSGGQKIFNTIYSHLLRANFQAANDFDNLRIPFRAVTTDLISGKRVVLKSGDLAEAISASVAFPLLFSPVEWDTMWLVDGGIRDNLPVDVAISNKADVTIAVDVTSPLRLPDQMKSPWQLADQVTTIMMQEPTKNSRKLVDVLLTPQVNDHGANDFSDIDSLIDAGYQAAMQKMDTIKLLIQNQQENLWGKNIYLGKAKEINIYGLHNTGLDTLIRDMVTQSGYSLYSYDLYQDLTLFYETGLLSEAYVLLKGESAAFVVEFHLSENSVIKRIELKNNSIYSDSLLLELINVPLNQVLNYNRLFRGLDKLQNHYVQTGYSLAKIKNVEFVQKTNSLVIDIDEGFITKIEINGNGKTKDYIILREFPLNAGQIFKAPLAVQGIRNIFSTELFDRVTLSVLKKTNEKSVLVIKVKEKKYFVMRLGGNVSLERKSKFFLDFSEDNFLGRQIEISLWGAISDLERRAEFNLNSVRLLNTLITYQSSVYYRERKDRFYVNFERKGNYLSIRRGAVFVLGQQIERLGSISAEIRWDRISLFSNSLNFPYKDNYRIRSIIIKSVVDKRDKLPFPDRGIYNHWFWENGSQRFLGSSVGFTRFFISLEGYYPLYQPFNYHILVSAGSSDQTLPFSEYFHFGGISEFPGLYERELFGRQMFRFHHELRYKISWQIPIDAYLAVNYNVGATWETSEDPIKKSDFLTSWGLNLGINSIFGPIRLAYGHLNGVRDILYFSLGFDF